MFRHIVANGRRINAIRINLCLSNTQFISTEKSESISRFRSLSLQEKPIPSIESVKYLGVRLNRSLCFNAHVTKTSDKASEPNSFLTPVLHSSGGKVSYHLSFVSLVGTDQCGSRKVVALLDRQQVQGGTFPIENRPFLVRISLVCQKRRDSWRSSSSYSACLCPVDGSNSFCCSIDLFLPLPEDHQRLTEPPPPVPVKRSRTILDDLSKVILGFNFLLTPLQFYVPSSPFPNFSQRPLAR